MRKAALVLALVGCAKGGVGQLAQGDANDVIVDGVVYKDAPFEPHDDAHVFNDAKVFEDAHVFNDAHIFNDAHVFQDAHVFMDACVPVQTELLTNGGFESNTTGWHEIQFDSELISSQFPQAGTYGAWLGSYDQTATDELYQDVVVPAGTTSLVLTGYWYVYTSETSTTTAYDKAYVSLATTTETPLETALTVTSLTPTTAYTAFTHSFATAAVAGTTVRFKVNSSSDVSNLTNFFFDTFSLKATHCP